MINVDASEFYFILNFGYVNFFNVLLLVDFGVHVSVGLMVNASFAANAKAGTYRTPIILIKVTTISHLW